MEHVRNISAGASTDEPALLSTSRPGAAPGKLFANPAEADAYWAGVNDGIRSVGAEASAPSPGGETAEPPDAPAWRVRNDGWLPWKKARFLDEVAAGASVAEACRVVGMSVASAYALRNRRSGRAFGRMWDAIVVNRYRCRLAGNAMARATDGWVEQVVRDGVVVAERRRFDNRLSMAMLTRLDRLAESKTDGEAAFLRALSEDFEEFLELIEAGGDEDCFVEERRPWPLDEEPDDLDALAALTGCDDWRDVHFGDVPVHGLDPDRKSEWSREDWVRAGRSYFLVWLDQMAAGGNALPPGPECAAAYDKVRRGILETMRVGQGEDEPSDSPDDNVAGQPSTSSTSPANRHERRRRRKLQKRARRA
jgi:hypothetical protein